MKSKEVMGDANKRIRNDDVRSFDNSIPENNAIKAVPNIAKPGARFSIENIVLFASAGMLALMTDSRTRSISGNPNPKKRFVVSRNISFVLRLANKVILIQHLLKA
jgi:hypothetical protein